jgi:hypothetical protein
MTRCQNMTDKMNENFSASWRSFSGFIIALRNIPEKFRKKSSGNVIIYQYCYCVIIMFFKYNYFLCLKMSIGRKSLTNLHSEMIFLQGKPVFYIFLPSTPPYWQIILNTIISYALFLVLFAYQEALKFSFILSVIFWRLVMFLVFSNYIW